MKDFEYWSPKIAWYQSQLAQQGKKTSRRLQRYSRLRQGLVRPAIAALARRIVAICRPHKVETVVISWPRGFLRETTVTAKWQRLRHGCWNFARMADGWRGHCTVLGYWWNAWKNEAHRATAVNAAPAMSCAVHATWCAVVSAIW